MPTTTTATSSPMTTTGSGISAVFSFVFSRLLRSERALFSPRQTSAPSCWLARAAALLTRAARVWQRVQARRAGGVAGPVAPHSQDLLHFRRSVPPHKKQDPNCPPLPKLVPLFALNRMLLRLCPD
eukprot:3342266-Rhodomonas_salina.1